MDCVVALYEKWKAPLASSAAKVTAIVALATMNDRCFSLRTNFRTTQTSQRVVCNRSLLLTT